MKTYGLLTKCSVKMAGYWPSSFFCVFMDRDGVEVNKLAKKERRNVSCGSRRVVPSGQDSSILPTQAANVRAGFESFYPLTKLAIQFKRLQRRQ